MVSNVTGIACRVGIAILVIGCVYSNAAAQSRTCPVGQFLAKYYKNETLSGPPVLVKCERTINNDWGTGGPTAPVARPSAASDRADTADESDDGGKADTASTVRSIGNDHFSVRWEGRFDFAAGDYTFVATADDGIKVWVDDQLIIDEWRFQGATQFRATQSLTAGIHRVRVEYFENGGGAEARLRW